MGISPAPKIAQRIISACRLSCLRCMCTRHCTGPRPRTLVPVARLRRSGQARVMYSRARPGDKVASVLLEIVKHLVA